MGTAEVLYRRGIFAELGPRVGTRPGGSVGSSAGHSYWSSIWTRVPPWRIWVAAFCVYRLSVPGTLNLAMNLGVVLFWRTGFFDLGMRGALGRRACTRIFSSTTL